MVGLCWVLVAASFVFWFVIAGCVGCWWLCCSLRWWGLGFGFCFVGLFRGCLWVSVWLLRFVYCGWLGACVGFVICVCGGVFRMGLVGYLVSCYFVLFVGALSIWWFWASFDGWVLGLFSGSALFFFVFAWMFVIWCDLLLFWFGALVLSVVGRWVFLRAWGFGFCVFWGG